MEFKMTFMQPLKFILLSLFFLQLSPAFGQKKEEEKLVQQIEAFRRALIDPSAEQLDALVLEQLSYGHSGGKVEDKKSFIENLLNGNSNFAEITFSDQQITIQKQTAIVRHKLFAKTNDLGKAPGEIHLQVLTVWQKQGRHWKLWARQAVKLP
jgi:ketosteroid isomerase-like protein